MKLRCVAIAVGLALTAPVLALAEDWSDEGSGIPVWAGEPPLQYEAGGPPGEPVSVDVSVDLGTPGASVTFETFRDGLAPYGEWVTVGTYGRVWRPSNVGPSWRPYYYGRWEWTDEGWLWVSDESWGWATYHYGRWTYDGFYGWLWVPGYQWAPAWVTWRTSPDYIGWAPLAPGFSVYVTSYPVHYTWWSFVPCNRFAGHPVRAVAYGGAHTQGIFHATRPAPPRATVFGAPAPAWGGPARPFVESRIGRPIAPVRLHPVASPAGLAAPPRAGVVPIYRPEVRAAPGRAALPASRPPAPPPAARPWGGQLEQQPGPRGPAPAQPFAAPRGPAAVPPPAGPRPPAAIAPPPAARPWGGQLQAAPQPQHAPPAWQRNGSTGSGAAVGAPPRGALPAPAPAPAPGGGSASPPRGAVIQPAPHLGGAAPAPGRAGAPTPERRPR